ncbi:unnamed protein product [Effrenium voratum]|uniref:MFS transporter n=1 Tax=Effrenium voratum TaxID=2562239 RepID=A0AA36NAC8_9DINO|nr:unnamed protein product [Effrenium voratum]CAJ1451895.1 unnamed protein product [Effrenium voratum]
MVDASDAGQRARRAFSLMTAAFSLSHAALTTAVMFATSALGDALGNFSNATLYTVSLLSSLVFAPWFINLLGPKRGLLGGLASCTVYLLCFSIAALELPGCACKDTREAVALVGAAVGGLGASLLWTGQGIFFLTVAQQLARPAKIPICDRDAQVELSKATSQLSSSFAFWLLMVECVVKLQLAAVQTFAYAKPWLFVLLGLAAVALVSFAFTDNLEMPRGTKMSMCSRAASALELWHDPTLWLLSLTAVSFGFSVAWLNSRVNAQLVEALGQPNLGFAGALTTAVAGVTSKLSGLAEKKGAFIALGAASFFLVGVLSTVRPASGWGLWVLLFYVLHGIGRGVYESTYKGVLGDFFPSKAVGAFANVLVQSMLPSITVHVLAALGHEAMANNLLIASAALTLPCFLLAGLRARTDLKHSDG